MRSCHWVPSFSINDVTVVCVEYTELGGDEELPLGAEFQDHIKIFVDPSKRKPRDKYKLLGKVVQQLE